MVLEPVALEVRLSPRRRRRHLLLPRRILDQRAAVLLTPDLLAQGLVPALLQRLGARGLEVVAAAPVRPSPPQVASMYDGALSHPPDAPATHGRWLSPALFDGTCLLLVLAEARPSAAPLQARVAAMKGRSRRGAAQPEALRSVSPWVDQHLSGLHSPDDTDSLAREVALLLGRTAARRALVAARPVAPGIVEALAAASDQGGAVHPVALSLELIGRCAALALGLDLGWGHVAAGALWQSAQSAVRAVPGGPGPARLDCRPLLACRPALVALADRMAVAHARALRRADLLGHARVHAALGLVRSLMPMAAGQPAFCAQASYIQAQAWRAAQLPLGRWERHRLHIFAAYP